MKILILGVNRFDSLEWNLKETFKKLSISCEIIDPFLFLPFKYRFIIQRNLRNFTKIEKYYWHKILNRLKDIKADIIISTVQDIPPEIVKEIKNITHLPVINWNPDSFNALIWNRERIITGDYDLWIYEDKYFERIFNLFSLPSLYIPEGFNPSIHKPLDIEKKEAERNGADIMIAGVLYPFRAKILENLTGYNLEIYGPLPFWLKSPVLKYHKGKYITGEE